MVLYDVGGGYVENEIFGIFEINSLLEFFLILEWLISFFHFFG